MAQWKQMQSETTRFWVRSLALISGLGTGIAVSCGVGRRHGSHPVFLYVV